MKFVSVILSLIILMLSFTPCADSSDYSKTSENIVVSVFEQDNHQKNHSDLCSPLCMCNCCGTVVAQIGMQFFKINEISAIPSGEETSFRLPIVSPLFYSIWEPPKIV